MRVHPAGDHIQVGIDPVEHGNAIPLVTPVTDPDFPDMVTNQR